jgi:hypothetical protein
MTETIGYRPPEAVVPAPTPEQSKSHEAFLDGPQEGYKAALMLGMRVPEDGKELSKRELKKIKKTGTQRSPKTTALKNASLHQRSKDWKERDTEDGITRTPEQQRRLWTKEADAYLSKFGENSPEGQFLKRIGVAAPNAAELSETLKKEWKHDPGKFAEAIVRNTTPQEREENQELIEELAKAFGKERDMDAVLLVKGITDVKNNPDTFAQSAQEQLKKGKDMNGYTRLEELYAANDAWIEKFDTMKNKIKQERKSEGHSFFKDLKDALKSDEQKQQEKEAEEKQNSLEERIKRAKAEAPDSKEFHDLLAKKDRGETLSENEGRTVSGAKIRTIDIQMKDDGGRQLSQPEVFGHILLQLSKDADVITTDDNGRKIKLSEDPSLLREWLEHEQAHFDEATKSYDGVSFAIQLTKDGNSYHVHPSTEWRQATPKRAYSPEEAQKVQDDILKAPGIAIDKNSVGGMSRHDMAAEGIGLYTYDGVDDTKGHLHEAVDRAREYMADKTNEQTISAAIADVPESAKEHAKQRLCLDIALNLKNNPAWQMSPEELGVDLDSL